MNKDYLPSKEFRTRIIAIAILVLIAIGVYQISIFFKNKLYPSSKNSLKIVAEESIQTDSNSNGIADWEEALWGFNPNINGEANKVAILAKKQELSSNSSVSNKKVTANENLSREFFALIMSLKESGNLNETSIKSVAENFGSQIKPTPLADAYTNKDQTIKITDKKADNVSYIKSLNTLLSKHKDLGTELSLVEKGVENSDPTVYRLVSSIGSSYISFSKEMIKIPVPNRMASIILSMANNYEKLGQSTIGLSQGSDDPIIGMKSLINYNTYNEALLVDTDNLSKNI